MADSPLKIGFNVPFAEAIKAAENRGVVLPDKYYGELQGIARQLAFSVAGLASLDQIQQVKDSLDEAIKNGESFNSWRKRITESSVLDLPKHRLDNIYRTNLQGQYMAGKWEKFERNKDTRPYLMYDAINDSRVRPAHLAMDGIIRRIDDPLWDTHSPVNGYRCRCSLISLTEEQAHARSGYDSKGKALGINKQATLPDGTSANPDKGWEYSPKDRLAGVKAAIKRRDGKASPALVKALDDKLSSMNAYEIAKNGGRHYGTWKNFKDRPEAMIGRSIKSMLETIALHQAWVNNPYLKLPVDADSRQVNALITEKCPSDIARLQEQIDILNGILEDKNNG